MSFLGIGAPEILLIVVLIVIILGPERARDAGVTVGRFIKRLTSSEFWRELIQATRFMQQLPQNLVKMAELEEITARLNQDMASVTREVQAVTRPLENMTPAKLFQEPLRTLDAVDQDLKKAISGSERPTASAGSAASGAGAASTASGASPSNAPSTAAEPFPVVQSGRPAEDNAIGRLPDDDLSRIAQSLTRYSEEWPTIVRRLDEIERMQAQLAEQVSELQIITAALPGVSSEDRQS